MPRPRGELGEVEIIGEGNYLQKSRRNFFLSGRCWMLLHNLSLELGINHSNVIEMAVRAYHQQIIGPVVGIPKRVRKDRDDF